VTAAGQVHARDAVPDGMMARFSTAWADPARRAKLLRNLWLVSTGFTLFGFAVMFYLVWSSR
jgi:hypothetical protein